MRDLVSKTAQALAERMMLALDEGYEGFGWKVFESGRSLGAELKASSREVAARLLQRPDGPDERRRADLLHDQGDHEPPGAVAAWSSTSGTSTSRTTALLALSRGHHGGPIGSSTSCGSTRSRCRSIEIARRSLVVPELGRDGDVAGNGFANHRSGDESCRRGLARGRGRRRAERGGDGASDSDDGRRADGRGHPGVQDAGV